MASVGTRKRRRVTYVTVAPAALFCVPPARGVGSGRSRERGKVRAHLPTLVSSVVVLAGCAVDDAARREVTSLRSQVDQMRARTSRDQRTIRELENRVFVLEDKLETVEVTQGKSSR